MTLYLSRLVISRSPSAQALQSLILPQEPGAKIDAHHKLLWSVFSDGPERTRDFLWREERAGAFLTLSRRPPVPHDLFENVESREFDPQIAPGSHLSFVLRANATRTKPGGQRVDVVMDALADMPKADRAAARDGFAQTEGRAWLERQGAQAGFSVVDMQAESYETVMLPGYRGPRRGQPQFGILSLTGSIEVADPAVFLARMVQGFGRAKAFGCGLMLIRRGG